MFYRISNAFKVRHKALEAIPSLSQGVWTKGGQVSSQAQGFMTANTCLEVSI
jgi:hypothetical protein